MENELRNSQVSPANQLLQAGSDETSAVGSRWSIYWLLIICSLAVVCARLWQVETLSYGERVPFLSANDRSRWCTVRSLGDHDTYAIDVVLADTDGKSWDTIDKVMHWGRDFQPHFYSSKLTLLPTLLAYPYMAIKEITGWTLKKDTFNVVRILLLLAHVVPLVLFFWAIARLGDIVAETEWARIFLMVFAGFGTFITTFAVTLNNHVPAAISVAVATYGMVLIHQRRTLAVGWYFVTGLTAAFAAANELPAVSFLLVCSVLCMWRSVSRTLLGFVPAVALVAAAFFGTNKIAHNDWQPPYAHRSDGQVLDRVEGEFDAELDRGTLPNPLAQAMIGVRDDLSEQILGDAKVFVGGWPIDSETARRWIVYGNQKVEPVVVARRADGTGYEIRQWNNWYEYPGSYWLDEDAKSKMDRGEPNQADYLLHLTVGHHGVFSLTPIWLLSAIGIIPLCFSRRYGLRLMALGILAISIAVVAFYVMRPLEDRNYGGWTCGPRWLFWLAPLWIVAMIPVLDWIGKRLWLRALATVLLVFSIASAFYAWTNPWVHPWIYTLWFE